MKVAGRVQLHVVVALGSLLPWWLLARGHSQLLEAIHIPSLLLHL